MAVLFQQCYFMHLDITTATNHCL